MEKLVVKLPFKRKSTRLEDKSTSSSIKTTSKERTRKYREKLKNDSKKLQELKQKRKVQNSKYREQVTKMRKTCSEYDQYVREKCRQRKQKERKRRKTQARKHTETYNKDQGASASSSKNVRNENSIRKRAERARHALPKDYKKWAETINHVVKTATPRRRSLLTLRQNSLNEINEAVGITKLGRPRKEDAKVKRKLAYTDKAQQLWSSKKQLGQYMLRKKAQENTMSKKQKYNKSWKGTIESFLERHSRVMPNKKDTINIDGKPVAKRHLLTTKKRVYNEFKKEYPDFNRKRSTFLKMMPRYIKKLDVTCRRVCVCSRDYNIEQKISALNKLANVKGMTEMKSSPRQLSNKSVCEHDKFPARECIDRKCCNCGTKAIQDWYEPLLSKCTDNDKVKFTQWETSPESYVNKEGKKISTRRWVQLQKVTDPESLVKEITVDMTTYTSHIFRANYQHFMEANLIANLPIDQCVVIMDFSQNITLQQQDEIESAHWTQKQVTLHPIHIVRHSPSSTESKPDIIHESLIIISDSLGHNSNAVYVYTEQLIAHLKNRPGPCSIKVIHRFSDNCATQYKSKDAFTHLQLIEHVHKIKVVYHYTESGHGKGRSDGHGAAIKRRLDRLILGGQVINNAYQVYLALAQSNDTEDQRIVYVPHHTIVKRQPPKHPGVKTVPGTQAFHMVQVAEPASSNNDEGNGCNSTQVADGIPERVLEESNEIGTRANVQVADVVQMSILEESNHLGNIETSLSSFSNSIAKRGWKLMGETPADGNCCFHAVSEQLEKLEPPQMISHTQLRADVVQYMKDLPEHKQEYIKSFLTQPLDIYLPRMARDGTYADHICLQSLATMLNLEILVVHEKEGEDVTISPTESAPNGKIILGYIPELHHYVCIEEFWPYQAGDFVAVRLSDRRQKRLFVAKVLEADTDLKIRFMKSLSPVMYTWPAKEDIAWHPLSDIIQKLTQPDLLPGRGIKLKFNSNELMQCKEGL